jgi:hypothetical protein
MTYSRTAAEAADALAALATALGASPLIKIYSGTFPATADASGAGLTLLATLTCSATPFPAAAQNSGVSAVATFNAITSATAAATGTATTFRLTTSGGTVIGQGSVGAGSGDLNLNTTSITSGSTVAITSATITQPV